MPLTVVNTITDIKKLEMILKSTIKPKRNKRKGIINLRKNDYFIIWFNQFVFIIV